MSNYPDGMDWGAYDDYHDPKLNADAIAVIAATVGEQYAGEGNQH